MHTESLLKQRKDQFQKIWKLIIFAEIADASILIILRRSLALKILAEDLCLSFRGLEGALYLPANKGILMTKAIRG
jgi:hypothetical protein